MYKSQKQIEQEEWEKIQELKRKQEEFEEKMLKEMDIEKGGWSNGREEWWPNRFGSYRRW